jgi:hypothetical protein
MGYSKIWSSLVNETKRDNKPKYKKPFPHGVTEVFYTVQESTFGRSILIEINAQEKNEFNSIPEINGWELSICEKTIIGTKKMYLHFTEKSIDTRTIAEMVIGDLSDNLKSLKIRNQLINTVIRTLRDWQFFFQSRDIMSKTAEQGLIGELSWLLQMIEEKEDPRKVIESWCGPDRSRHDFEFADKHFEIKTTSSKNRLIHINSEHQLNNKGLKHLYLIVYKYNLIKSAKPTLPMLYDNIIGIIGDDKTLKERIILNCAKIGYNDKKRNKHQYKYEIDGVVEIYGVVNRFPKLLLTPKMSGIHNVTYSIDVQVCQQHRINLTNIFPI